jgi:RNA polymerase sigma factor (sigma-70 family)
MKDNSDQRDRIYNLVTAIQAGERDKLHELWNETEKLFKWWSNRLLITMPGADFNDLYQCGYIALAAAVETFEPKQGSFTHWLAYYFKNEIANFFGYKTKRQREDPLHKSLSLDAPIIEGDNDYTLADTIRDDTDPYETIDEQVFREQLHDELEIALTKLTENQEVVIRRRYYKNQPTETVAKELNVTKQNVSQSEHQGLRAIKNSKSGNRLYKYLCPDGERRIDERTNFYRRSSLDSFNSTGLSAVELIAIQREDWREGELEKRVKALLQEWLS